MRAYPYWQVLLVFFLVYGSAAGLATFLVLMTPQISKRKKKPLWPLAAIVFVFVGIWMVIDRAYSPEIYGRLGFADFLSTWAGRKITFRR
jgi:predicted branched-subunit amino acid permease